MIVLMMNPLTVRGIIEVAKSEIPKEEKKEARKKQLQIITNNEQ